MITIAGDSMSDGLGCPNLLPTVVCGLGLGLTSSDTRGRWEIVRILLWGVVDCVSVLSI